MINDNKKILYNNYEDEYELWLEKGYLLYLYFSCATNMYECKPIDPKYYSKNLLENFRNRYTANHKLYDNIEDMLSDRKELNNII